MHTTFVSQPL